MTYSLSKVTMAKATMAKTAMAALTGLMLALPAAAEVADKPLTPVSVGILFFASDSGIMVAKDRGYFAEQGIEVNLERFASGADINALLATDKLDVGSGGASPGLYNAFRQGMDLQIVASKAVMMDPQSGTGSLLVRKDLWDSGKVRKVADLKGMRIAVNAIQSTSLNYTLRGLAVGGLSRDDVTIVEMPFSQFIPAFKKQAFDAAMVYSPLSETISDKLDLAVDLPEASASVTSRGDAPNMLFYSPGFAESPLAVPFMVAFLKGTRDYRRAINDDKGGREEVCAIIHGYISNIPPDCAGIKMSEMLPDAGLDPAALERYQDEWLEWGVMREPADVRSHVNTSFIDRAVAQLGPYKD